MENRVFLGVMSLLFAGSMHAEIVRFNDEKQVLPLLLQYLPQNPIILEAGAFDGADTVEYINFFNNHGYKAHIYCFEPVPELYVKTLAKTRNISQIQAYDLALSDKIGTDTMYISEWSNQPGEASQSSSLMPPLKHLQYAPDVYFKNIVEIQTITIDAWAEKNNIDHIDYLKLDIQGSELPVLKASPKILKTVKAIMLEVEFVEAYKGQSLYSEIRSWLHEQGFEMVASFGFNAENPAPAWFGDALFVRRELLSKK